MWEGKRASTQGDMFLCVTQGLPRKERCSLSVTRGLVVVYAQRLARPPGNTAVLQDPPSFPRRL